MIRKPLGLGRKRFSQAHPSFWRRIPVRPPPPAERTTWRSRAHLPHLQSALPGGAERASPTRRAHYWEEQSAPPQPAERTTGRSRAHLPHPESALLGGAERTSPTCKSHYWEEQSATPTPSLAASRRCSGVLALAGEGALGGLALDAGGAEGEQALGLGQGVAGVGPFIGSSGGKGIPQRPGGELEGHGA